MKLTVPFALGLTFFAATAMANENWDVDNDGVLSPKGCAHFSTICNAGWADANDKDPLVGDFCSVSGVCESRSPMTTVAAK